MALNKQNITISFAQGMETKVDPKQVVVGSLNVLENAVFDEIGAFRKRNGYDLVTLNVLNEDAITAPTAIATFKDELLTLTDSSLYSLSETASKWVNKGELKRVLPETTPVIRNIYTQSDVDALCISGINVYVWKDSRGGVRYTVMDEQNNSTFVSDSSVSATGEKPKLSNIGNIIYIFYVDGTDLKFRKINPIKPTVLESEVTAVSDVDGTDKNYDTQAIGDQVFVGYQSSAAGGELRYFHVDIDDTISSIISKVGESAANCVNVSTDESSNFIAVYSDGTDIKRNIYNYKFNSEILAPAVVETVVDITNASTVETSTGEYTVVYEKKDADTKNYLLRKNTFDISGTVDTPAEVLRSVGLQSNAFMIGDVVYVLAMHESTFQSTYFVIDITGKVHSKSSAGLGGTHRSESSVAEVSSLSSSKVLIPTQIKSRTISENNQFFTSLGVQSIVLDFGSSVKYQKLSMADNLLITGGFLQMYDGQSVTEHGFHIYPEDLAQSANAASGGSLEDGTYNYIAVYSWTDAQGLLHFSSPSLGFEATASAGGAAQTLSIDIPMLRITDKTNVIIDLYRTVKDGTIFHKVTTIASPEVNDPTLDSITITDGISDTDLISNELLYTTGGILENIAPSATQLITGFNNRAMIIPADKPNTLQYSKLNADGEPIEFNDLQTKRIGRDEEPVTAFATLDDKFILFKRTSMYFISGEGPNNAGTQDTFTEPEIISSDIGCEQPDSIVLIPDGLMFMSNKGIYLLTRGLGLQYIGAPMEDFNDQQLTSAKLIPSSTQVRFTIADNVTLVYDYFVQQWATFTNHAGKDALVLNGLYYYLNSAGQVYKENSSSFTDAGSPINIAIETTWISFAGLQGYQRVYRLSGLGEYLSPHKLRVRTAHDFKEAFINEKVIDTADFTDDSRYGDDSPYGSGSPFGGDGNVYQFRLDMKKQKTQAIKIRIEEIQDPTELGEGLAIGALTFKVGAKKGLFKVDDDNKQGVQSA